MPPRPGNDKAACSIVAALPGSKDSEWPWQSSEKALFEDYCQQLSLLRDPFVMFQIQQFYPHNTKAGKC